RCRRSMTPGRGSRGTVELESYRDRIVSGPLVPTLLRLGAPPMLSQMINLTYNILNSLWLSLFSESAIAVPRQVFPVQFFFMALLNALGTAGTSIVSQYVGAKMFKEVKREFSRLFTAAVLLGSLSSAAFFALRPLIFGYVVATPPEIYDYVMGYTAVTSLNMMISAATMTLTTGLTSVGETKLPSLINFAGMAVNTALDPVFILGIGPVPRLGPIGSALTDTIGLLISLSLLMAVFNRRFSEIRPSFTRDYNAAWMKLVARIGGPVALMSMLNSSAFMMQLRLVNSFGVEVATAYSIGFIVLDIADAAMWGLSGSIAIIVGQLLGAGMLSKARSSAIKGSLFIASIVAVSSFVIYFAREPIVRVFTSNPVVIEESLRFLDTILLGLPFFAFFMCGFSAARGAGRTLAATLINIGRLWGIRVGLSYVLAFTMALGPLGVWIGIMLSNIAGGLLMGAWLVHGKWARPVITELNGNPSA
ncbi:MAG: MATE family efflux transporter, partial [Thermofilaceae archaeon]